MSTAFTNNSRLAATTIVLAILALGLTTLLVLPVGAQTSSVTIVMPQGVGTDQSLNFQPASVTVAAGTTVTFSDQDTSAPHDVVWDTVPTGASPANSPVVMTNGQTFSVTLTVPGTYTYHCEFHSGWMKATIIVSAGATSSSTSSSSSSTPVVTSTSSSITVSPTTISTSTSIASTTTSTSTSSKSTSSATSTTSTSSATATSTTTSTSGTGTSTLKVVSQQSNGAALTGYHVTLVAPDGTTQACYTTCTFTVNNGQTYQVIVDSFANESLNHFSDNKGSIYWWGGLYSETIPSGSASSTVTLTAVYTSSQSTTTTTTTTTSSSSTSAVSSSSATSTSHSTSTTASTSTSISSSTKTSTTTSSSSSAAMSTTTTSSTTTTTTSSSSAASSGGATTIVMPQNVGADQTLNFSPASVTVAPGTVVTFADQDSQSGAPHDVVWTSVPSGASPANSPQVMTSGQTYSVTLTVPGTYSYDCIFHSGWMHATITVS